MSQPLDVLIVGAGPAGLACAIEAGRLGLDYLVLEKGCLVNSIFRFPANMTFFTTAELLEIGDVPLVVSKAKPDRLDALNYYRRVADSFRLRIRDYQKVEKVSGRLGDFTVRSRDRDGCERTYQAKRLIIAIGYFDNPNLMGIPGEDLAKVNHYYTEPHPFYKKRVVVIGGKNSAAVSSLDLYRHGAEVTLIHRGRALGREIKYWVRPDIENRIKNGEIAALMESRVLEILPDEVVVETPGGIRRLDNDFVFALTGYHPDPVFLRALGVELDPDTYVPKHDPETLQSNVPGIYLAGAIVSGKMTNKIFIENGRFHGSQIFSNWPEEKITV